MFKSIRREALILFLFSSFAIALSFFRLVATHHWMYLFLNWNLFLAAVPWLLTSTLSEETLTNKKWFAAFLVASWAAVFPNAPYILTDLFHLRIETHVPVWYDLILILSFASAGLAFGYYSLQKIRLVFSRFFRIRIIDAVIAVYLYVCAFGVYLGRFERWNSWDIITNTSGVFTSVGDRSVHPFHHPRTWAVTILLGTFLNLLFLLSTSRHEEINASKVKVK